MLQNNLFRELGEKLPLWSCWSLMFIYWFFCIHQLSICYIVVGFSDTENNNNDNYNKKKKKTQTKPSFWPQEVYSPEWRKLKSLWGKYHERYMHRRGTQIIQGNEGQRANVSSTRWYQRLSLVEAGGGKVRTGVWVDRAAGIKMLSVVLNDLMITPIMIKTISNIYREKSRSQILF